MKALWSLAALCALAATLACAVAFGSEPIPAGEIAGALGRRLGASGGAGDGVAEAIIWDLRLPRALLAFIVGSGLALSGVAMQALVRNPLAEPYILGMSSGASAGVSLFYLGFLPPLLSRSLSIPLAAFVGGLASIALVMAVARPFGYLSVTRLLLAGVAVSSLMSAVTSFVTIATPEAEKVRTVLFWMLGSLGDAEWSGLALPAAVVGGLGAALWMGWRTLDALLLGEEPAQMLGAPVEALKRALIAGTALVVGVLVAASGAIGFVGLIVPHAARAVLGVSHRRVAPASAFAGGLFLVWADLLARTVLPHVELPVGIITSVCGAPVFLYLLRTRSYRFGSG